MQPSAFDRATIFLLRNPQVFESQLPNVLGILGFVLTFVLVGVQSLPAELRITGIALGLLALGTYVAVTVAARPRNLLRRLAGRFRERAGDRFVYEVLLTSRDTAALESHLLTNHPHWHVKGLAEAIRADAEAPPPQGGSRKH